MSISVESNKNTYVGTGAVSTYSFTYMIFEHTDLVVTKRSTVGVETALTINVDYTVDYDTSDRLESGGSITLSSPLETDYTLVIERIRPVTQSTEFRNQRTFYPRSHEDSADHIIMVAQQHDDLIDRSVKLPSTIEAPSSFDPSLPSTISEASSANRLIAVNSTSDGFSMSSTIAEILAAANGGGGGGGTGVWSSTVSSTQSASFTAAVDNAYLLDPSGGSFTVTVPAASIANAGKVIVLKNATSSRKIITVTPSSSTIEGISSYVMRYDYQTVAIQSDGVSNWNLFTYTPAMHRIAFDKPTGTAATDTARIQEMFDDAVSEGLKIKLGTGTWVMESTKTRTWDTTNSGIMIEGSGHLQTILQNEIAVGGAIFQFSQSSTFGFSYGYEFDNLKFLGPQTATPNWHQGVVMGAVNSTYFRRCLFEEFDREGVRFSNLEGGDPGQITNMTFDACRFRYCGTDVGYALDCGQSAIVFLNMTNCEFAHNGGGIWAQPYGCIIQNTGIYYTKARPAMQFGYGSASSRQPNVQNCWFEGNSAGNIRLSNCSNGTFTNNFMNTTYSSENSEIQWTGYSLGTPFKPTTSTVGGTNYSTGTAITVTGTGNKQKVTITLAGDGTWDGTTATKATSLEWLDYNGHKITLDNCSNPENEGSWFILDAIDNNTFVISNPNAVAEGSGFYWLMEGRIANNNKMNNDTFVVTRGGGNSGDPDATRAYWFRYALDTPDVEAKMGKFIESITKSGTTFTVQTWSSIAVWDAENRNVKISGTTSNDGTYEAVTQTDVEVPSGSSVASIANTSGDTWRYTMSSSVVDFDSADLTNYGSRTVRFDNCANATNDGTFTVTAANSASNWIEVTNTGGVAESGSGALYYGPVRGQITYERSSGGATESPAKDSSNMFLLFPQTDDLAKNNQVDSTAYQATSTLDHKWADETLAGQNSLIDAGQVLYNKPPKRFLVPFTGGEYTPDYDLYSSWRIPISASLIEEITRPGGNTSQIELESPYATSTMVGRIINITGCTNAGNNGKFVVDSVVDTYNFTITNASGVAEAASPGTMTYDVFRMNNPTGGPESKFPNMEIETYLINSSSLPVYVLWGTDFYQSITAEDRYFDYMPGGTRAKFTWRWDEQSAAWLPVGEPMVHPRARNTYRKMQWMRKKKVSEANDAMSLTTTWASQTFASGRWLSEKTEEFSSANTTTPLVTFEGQAQTIDSSTVPTAAPTIAFITQFTLDTGVITATLDSATPIPAGTLVGKKIIISGSTSSGNDGEFTVSTHTSTTSITFSNGSGVTEAGVSKTTAIRPQKTRRFRCTGHFQVRPNSHTAGTAVMVAWAVDGAVALTGGTPTYSSSSCTWETGETTTDKHLFLDDIIEIRDESHTIEPWWKCSTGTETPNMRNATVIIEEVENNDAG